MPCAQAEHAKHVYKVAHANMHEQAAAAGEKSCLLSISLA